MQAFSKNANPIGQRTERLAFNSLLVANRGEIACRILRTARDLGLRTIAVYSQADSNAPHVLMADEAVLIGPGPVGQSYLDPQRILKAAKKTGATAVHPGYGFLSENDGFAEAVNDAGLVFVGPSARAIYLMGNKAEAKRLMIAAGVPCVPGYQEADQSDAVLIKAAETIGYPLMVKAAAGGGGRGMRLVDKCEDLENALSLARSEAISAFGSGTLILEKAIQRPRHVEIQIFADSQGNYIHLGERDCSVQRRHQKVIEESPCPVMTPHLRAQMGSAAIAAAKAVDYCGAGTVEFLLDASGNFYFLEMNTRLQVEHPVTEMVTGLDLVALQLSVAQGNPLPLKQEDVRLDGHAMEVRLYAEDPAQDFLPVTGVIDLWRPAIAKGVRVDDGICTGMEVSPYYDPMLAKIIAWGPDRQVAHNRLTKALRASVLFGPTSNATFLIEALETDTFVKGEATTAFIEETFASGIELPVPSAADAALAAVLFLRKEQNDAFARAGYVSRTQLGWSSSALPPVPLQLTSNSETFNLVVRCMGSMWTIKTKDDTISISVDAEEDAAVSCRIDGRTVFATGLVNNRGDLGLAIGQWRYVFHRVQPGQDDKTASGGGQILAPMPGLIIDLVAVEGQTVAKGDVLAVLEAMKMQHQITAHVDGVIKSVGVRLDSQIAAGDVIVEIEEPTAAVT